jgi:colicin import membrane protein
LNSNKGLTYSLIAHAVFLLMMILQVAFYPDKAVDLSRAIRVDMIALPDKIDTATIVEETAQSPEKTEPIRKNELPEKISPEIEKPQPTKPEPKILIKTKPIDDSINLNKSIDKKVDKAKLKQKEALNKLKAMSAIDKLKKEMSDNKSTEPKQKTVFKGRALNAGTSLTGLDKLQSDSYLAQLDTKIKSHWSLPQWLIGKILRARVHIKFDENGNLTYKAITQSSGNPTYDEYCLLAIDKSLPLPRVPDKFSNVYKIDGVVIGFPD